MQTRFDDARDMFMTKGWKQLMEALKEFEDAITIDRITTLEELHYQKGRLEILRVITTYEDQIRARGGARRATIGHPVRPKTGDKCVQCESKDTRSAPLN